MNASEYVIDQSANPPKDNSLNMVMTQVKRSVEHKSMSDRVELNKLWNRNMERMREGDARRLMASALTKAPRQRSVRSHIKTVSNTGRAGMRRAAQSNEYGIITEPDDGESKMYSRSGYRYYSSNGQLYYDEQSGMTEIVEAANGDVYIKDFISGVSVGTWIKGIKDGEYITIPAGQILHYWPDYGYGMYLTKASYVEESGWQEVDGDIVLFIDGNTISLEDTDGNNIVAAFWTDDYSFSGYGDYNTVFTYDEAYVAPEPIALPEGAVVETWYGSLVNNSSATVKRNVNIAFYGDDVYLGGIFENYPDSWIKGTINNNVVTFSGFQYLGNFSSSYEIFAIGTNGEVLEDFQMEYDPEAQTMISTNSLLANAAKDKIYYLEYYQSVALSKDKPALPQAEPVSIPFYTDFSTQEAFDNFVVYDANEDGYTWNWGGHNNVYYSYTSYNDADDYLVMAVNFETGKAYNLNTSVYCASASYPERFEVVLGKSIEELTTTLIAPTEVTNEQPVNHGCLFSVEEDGTYYIAIHAISNADQWRLHITNINICYDQFSSYFNFNESDHATSNSGNEGDIVEDETMMVDGITMTVSPNSTGTPNRYWSTNNGPQLRMYGGKMIIVAPEGRAITSVEYFTGKWNPSNMFNGEAAESGTWNGNSTNLILEVAANTQINQVRVDTSIKNEETTTYYPPSIANTLETAYTVSEAIDLIEVGIALNDVVFVKGFITQIDNYTDGAITYWISEDGTLQSPQFECYKGTWEGMMPFESIDDIQVGAEVIVKGVMTRYNETYEFRAGNELVWYNAPAKPLFADGTYYIYNIGTGKYLAAGSSWGTHAIVNEVGLDYGVKFEDGKYTLDSQISNGGDSHFLNGEWNDGAAMGWTFEAFDNAYYITDGTNYLTAFEDGTVMLTESPTIGSQWQVRTPAERIAELSKASVYHPVDATFLMKDPNFGRNDLRKSAWLGDDFNVGGDVTNMNAEKWGGNSQTFNIYQKLNVPDGLYRLTWNGFYRYNDTDENTNEVAAAAHADGSEVILSYVYMNDKDVALTSIADETAVNALGMMPFSQGDASNAFGKGLYEKSANVIVSDGMLVVGVKKIDHIGTDWTVWDNFRLTYLGEPVDINPDDPELVAPEGWTNLITNGNLASDDVSSFISKVYPNVEDMFGATIAEGAGVNGSRGIVVSTPEAEEAETWDSQFWINLNRALPEGTILHVEFDYAASDYSWASTQAHGEPSVYHHWVCLGNVEFAQEWQHFSTDIEVSEEMAKGANGDGIGLKSIAFNLNDDKKAVDYFFDNFGVWAQLPKGMDVVDLTTDMFFSWTDGGAYAKKTGRADYCEYVLDEYTSAVYGDPNVSVYNYADLSAYSKLVLEVEDGMPRFLLNRDIDEGLWSENEDDSHLIDNTKSGWSSKYFSQEDNTYIVDVKAIVNDKGFCHLHSIKGANWQDVYVTSMKLYGDDASFVKVPTIVKTYPEQSSFNVYNGIMEFSVTFDRPVQCEYIEATLNGEPLTVLPEEGARETVFLARQNGDELADGKYTIHLTGVCPAGDFDEDFFLDNGSEFTFSFTVGQIDLNPEVNVEDILADELWDATPENGIPAGYLVNINGEERTSENQYGSGPRMFVFAEGGDFTHGLYFREGYTQYGSDENYPLYLEAGKEYTINFKSAMWKENGQKMNFQILNNNEDIVFEQSIENNPNLNGDRSPVEGATNTTIKFVPDEDGNYLLRWVSDGFSEVLLANPTVKYYSGTVYEEVVAFFAALENAKQERDASADFMDNEEYGSLDYEINWAESEYQYFTNFNQFMEAAKELENVAYRMKEYRRLYQEYYPLAETMLALRQQYADTKFTQSYIYNHYLIRCIDNYAPYGEILDQYNLGNLSNAYSDIKYAVNMVQDMFTEGPSRITMTGYAVLTERIRQGAETMRTLGIENEDLLWAAEYVLEDEYWLVDEIKQSIKKDIYKKLSKGENTLFDPIIDDETGEEVTPAYNMNIYVENPNIYKWGYCDKGDFSVPGWYVENANLSTGWTNYDSWDVPADAMFSNWGNYFYAGQGIGDLPAGTYTVKFAVGERQEDTYTDSYAFVWTNNGGYTASIDYIGQTFPEFSVNNGIVTIENVVVTDGYIEFGVQAESGSHLFFNEVQLLLTAPAPGYDYYDESEVLVGDVNLDGEVTTSDAVATVGIVLEDWQPSYRQFRAADVNYSYNITVSDVVGVVNIALNGYEWYRALARSQSMEQEINYLTQDANKIGLNNTTEFVAFQMDVTLADGAMLNGVNLNQRANGLNIRYSHLEGNTYRIMAFSMNMAAITGNEGELLSFDITGNQTVTLSNIEFTDSAARAYALGVNDATGINGIMAGDANADYYTVDGVKSNKMRKGMNVVKTADGKVRKMFVK